MGIFRETWKAFTGQEIVARRNLRRHLQAKNPLTLAQETSLRVANQFAPLSTNLSGDIRRMYSRSPLEKVEQYVESGVFDATKLLAAFALVQNLHLDPALTALSFFALETAFNVPVQGLRVAGRYMQQKHRR